MFIFREPPALFEIIICWMQAHGQPHLLFCVHMGMQQSIFKTYTAVPINPFLLQSATLVVFPGREYYSAVRAACTKPLPPLRATFLCLQVYR